MTGRELRLWREGWGLTQVELGRLLGFSNETISRFEREAVPIQRVTELALLGLDIQLQIEKDG